jgi:hypothetical protein
MLNGTSQPRGWGQTTRQSPHYFLRQRGYNKGMNGISLAFLPGKQDNSFSHTPALFGSLNPFLKQKFYVTRYHQSYNLHWKLTNNKTFGVEQTPNAQQ